MKHGEFNNLINHSRRGRGAVLLILLVLLAISLGLVGAWAQSIVRENQRMTEKLWRIQATRLAEAGIRRAEARHASDAQFSEETWNIPAEDLGSKRAAAVRIRVTADGAARTVQYQATAEYPAGATHRAQITERITVSLTSEEGQREGSS